VKVNVKLHAVLRDLLPDGVGEVVVGEEASVAALLDSLKIDPELRELVTVNGAQVQDFDTRLNDGDAVQVFPAVAGG
jgi:molybdopterin converting factor small subunit